MQVVSCDNCSQTRLCDFTGFLPCCYWLGYEERPEDQSRGLVWGLTAELKDFDFADETALFSCTQKDMQDKTDSTDQMTGSTWL